jgi:conjugative transfer region protein TrbK
MTAARAWIAIPVGLAGAVGLLAGRCSPQPAAGGLGGPAAAVAGARPQAEALRRCRGEGAGALDDPACQAAWAAARRRFLGGRP